MSRTPTMRIAVAIPCYKVTRHVLEVIAAIGPEVEAIYAVDDACPEGSGDFIEQHNTDARVRVLRNPENRGVGGAIVTAYKAALADGMDIVVKIDGDGQMDPALLPLFVRPLLQGRADYTKGNRFFRPESMQGMPPVRQFGNAVLSFITKLSCGYWNVMDPTNGYTAVRTCVLAELPLDKLEQRYFFETDMLFRLNTVRGWSRMCRWTRCTPTSSPTSRSAACCPSSCASTCRGCGAAMSTTTWCAISTSAVSTA